jgi:fructose-1-phosphate kinase PfkB-like protein
LTGRSEQFEAAREVARDVEHVILTRGEEGAFLFTRRLECRASVAVEKEKLQNTVGCGDALLAAFVASQCNGEDTRTSLAKAVATATASACHEATAKFDPDLLAELQEDVLIEGIETT